MLDLIARPSYLDKLDEQLDTPEIKVLTGMRRCGKSSLLTLFRNELLSRGEPSENIIYMRFDDFGVPFDADASWLQVELQRRFEETRTSAPVTIFLDEIQTVANWELVVRQLHTRSGTRVFLTGSNAYLLSSELATHITGRYLEIPVYPLSYREYLDFRKASGDRVEAGPASLGEYVRDGGLPGMFHQNRANRGSMMSFYKSVYDSMLVNDVMLRAHIRDVDMVMKVARYLFTTSGNLFSSRKLAASVTSVGRPLDQKTLDNYVAALEAAYMLYECPQEYMVGKSLFKALRKFYPCDTGLRTMFNGYKTVDVGFGLENVVYLELLRRGWRASVGVAEGKEIDFVCTRGDEKEYIQVTQSMIDPGVAERELAPFDLVNDSFPKTVLTLDGAFLGVTEKGYRVESLVDWLLHE